MSKQKGTTNGSSIVSWVVDNAKTDILHIQDNVTYKTSSRAKVGILFLTNLQMILVCSDIPRTIEVIRIKSIRKIVNLSMPEKETGYLRIFCKDIRVFTLSVPSKALPKLQEFLHNLAFPPEYALPAYIIYNKTYYVPVKEEINGWCLFDPEKEYSRLGLSEDPYKLFENKDYNLCDTYPEKFSVPSEIDDFILPQCATFRSRNRLPAITWRNKLNNTIIARCSQPMTGILNKRGKLDEVVLDTLRMISKGDTIFILDVRPKVNAKANAIIGGGFETTKHYKNVEIEWHSIENIHKVRECWKKLYKVCTTTTPSDEKIQTLLQDTMWYYHLSTILIGAEMIRDLMIKRGISVIVHCSDGWDRTSQVIALAELMMDPYYRTLEGFVILIEKEWCSFGHQFALREGHGKDMHNYKDDQRAPIFLQFIDCVFQLLCIFPEHFEFNSQLLLIIMDHFHSCMFGTFLFNSEKSRRLAACLTETHSLWDFVYPNKSFFINLNYKETTENLVTDFKNIDLRFWTEYYLRWQAAQAVNLEECNLQKLTMGLYFYQDLGYTLTVPRVAHPIPEEESPKKPKSHHIHLPKRRAISEAVKWLNPHEKNDNTKND